MKHKKFFFLCEWWMFMERFGEACKQGGITMCKDL